MFIIIGKRNKCSTHKVLWLESLKICFYALSMNMCLLSFIRCFCGIGIPLIY